MVMTLRRHHGQNSLVSYSFILCPSYKLMAMYSVNQGYFALSAVLRTKVYDHICNRWNHHYRLSMFKNNQSCLDAVTSLPFFPCGHSHNHICKINSVYKLVKLSWINRSWPVVELVRSPREVNWNTLLFCYCKNRIFLILLGRFFLYYKI